MHTWLLHGERRRRSFKCLANELKERECRPVAVEMTKAGLEAGAKHMSKNWQKA